MAPKRGRAAAAAPPVDERMDVPVCRDIPEAGPLSYIGSRPSTEGLPRST
jgi:hypothetical protein